MSKPLFVALRLKWFEAFAAGEKTEELRLYGRRWNERTCAVGRDVVLSCGYGKARRLRGRITMFRRQHGSAFGSAHRAAIEEVFGSLDVEIAAFTVTDLQSVEPEGQRHAAD